MTTLGKALILAIFFAVIAAIAGLSYLLPWADTSWRQALLGIGSLCCFGFLLGGIYAFDPESELKITSSAIGRISFGITASLMLSALWRWQLEGAALACFIGAVLGYFGMTWAKYADF
jgi:hypothetical protein